MPTVTLRLFAGPREAVGRREVALDVREGATVRDVLDALVARHPALERWRASALVSVNAEFAAPEDPVRAGDEIAFMPPVSGGAGGDARLAEGALSVDALLAGLDRDGAGAAVAFLGLVRGTSGERAGARVDRLEFEAYPAMAERGLDDVRARAVAKFGLVDCAIRHRVGSLATGETIVLVVVTAAHRREAFEAASWVMDELKTVVPIWKKEVGPDGTRWVNDPEGAP